MLSNELNLKKLFSKIGLLYFLGIPISVFNSIFLARVISVEDFGKYGFIISLSSVFSIFISGGIPLFLIREIAGNKSPSGVINRTFKNIILKNIFLIIIFFVICRIFNVGSINNFIIISTIIIFSSLNAFFSGILKGFKKPFLSDLIIQVFHPLIFSITLISIYYFGYFELSNVIRGYITTLFLILIFNYILYKYFNKSRQIRKKNNSSKFQSHLNKSILLFTLIAGANLLFTQLNIILLGFFSNPESISYFRVAERIFQLSSIPYVIINTIIAPYISENIKEGRIDKINQLSNNANKLYFVATTIIFFILLLFGKEIIFYTFGEEYSKLSYLPMIIIVFSHLVCTSLGSGVLIISMAGKQIINVIIHYFSLIIMLVISLFLIKSLGLLGSSLSVSIGILINSFLSNLYVRKKLKINVGIV